MAYLTYPFDLPEQRRVRMELPLGWFNVKHIAVVDERRFASRGGYMVHIASGEGTGLKPESGWVVPY